MDIDRNIHTNKLHSSAIIDSYYCSDVIIIRGMSYYVSLLWWRTALSTDGEGEGSAFPFLLCVGRREVVCVCMCVWGGTHPVKIL